MRKLLLANAVALLALAGACTTQSTPQAVAQSAEATPVVISSAEVELKDGTYALSWTASNKISPIDVFVSSAPDGENAKQIADDIVNGAFSWSPADPQHARHYFTLTPQAGEAVTVAVRVLPLEQASNFRDIGGYTTKDGKTVKWGRAYRSGAMPLLTEKDYTYISSLDLDSVVDFRSLEEREVTPDQIDDRTGALFLANDYSLAPLMKDYQTGDGENVYRKMEQLLAPQFRAMFKRLIADDGAVLYHCSAGQDRTGMATALIYDLLGVDRDTIVKDYHKSTELRRTQWEMPDLNPEDYPGNFIVQYYMAARAEGKTEAEPLYTPSGTSHLVQFFDYLDTEYGGTEGYLTQALGLDDSDIQTLRKLMLN